MGTVTDYINGQFQGCEIEVVTEIYIYKWKLLRYVKHPLTGGGGRKMCWILYSILSFQNIGFLNLFNLLNNLFQAHFSPQQCFNIIKMSARDHW